MGGAAEDINIWGFKNQTLSFLFRFFASTFFSSIVLTARSEQNLKKIFWVLFAKLGEKYGNWPVRLSGIKN